MAITAWWSGDNTERYWVEVTDRSDLGENLHTPKASTTGTSTWGYELVNYVQPGDVVFHWHKRIADAGPALVAWSVATGDIEDTQIKWQAHGTYGRAAEPPPPRPAWLMPLVDYTPLDPVITYDDIKSLEPMIRTIEADLRETHGGPLYFPFSFSEKRPIRTTQTYLAKFPRALAELLGIADVTGELVQGSVTASPAVKQPIVKPAGQGYISDSRVRRAIERRAVDVAVSFYRELYGFDAVTYTGDNKPYDLEVLTSSGLRRVEVKGTTGTGETVELTANEVDNAREHPLVDLFVVLDIGFERLADGNAMGFGGVARVWENWDPDDTSLKVTRYRHTVPLVGYSQFDTD